MKKTVLITGVSRGIGQALADVFLHKGYRVIGACRSLNAMKTDNPDFEGIALDLSDMNSLQAFEAAVQKRGLNFDMLINNAGIGPDLETNKPDHASFLDTFSVNVTGAVFFTELMLKHLQHGAKIIHISSKMGSLNLCTQDDAVAYRMSKAALNMYARTLANRLGARHSVATVHPGWVRTTISPGNINGRLSPEESAGRIFDFAISHYRTGIFWNVETQSECPW